MGRRRNEGVVVGPVPDTWVGGWGGGMIFAKLATIPSRPIKVRDNLTLPLKPWTDCKEEATVMADSSTKFGLNCFPMIVTLLFLKNTDLIIIVPT